MNTFWSENVQSKEVLYKSRMLRFDREGIEDLSKYIKLENGMRVLEVGCGSGVLSMALKRYYPKLYMVGIDLDTAFIEFSKEKSKKLGLDCCFIEGDALNLPFEEASFDVTISHTVCEHIETKGFLSQQYKVLKDGGVCTVLSSRQNININPESWSSSDNKEIALYEKLALHTIRMGINEKIQQYQLTEQELPRAMEIAGFKNVSTDFIAMALTIDSSNTSRKKALAIIDSNRQIAIDCFNSCSEALTEEEQILGIKLANERFDERLKKYNNNEKIWDTSVSIIMIVQGVK